MPDHGILLANAVRWATNGALPLSLKGPGHIDCKLYRQDNRLIVHLTNLTGANRTGYLDEFTPVGPFTVVLDAQDLHPKRAFATVNKKKIPMRVQNGQVSFDIAQISDFEMVVIE